MNNINQNKSNVGLNIVFIISFMWISIFPVCSGMVADNFMFNFGNLFNINSSFFEEVFMNVVVLGLIYWVSIELIYVLYRFVLSFKIYSYILPEDKLKREFKTYFIYRNIYYGLFLNLCFLYPCFYAFLGLMNILITTLAFVLMANNIRKVYSEPIISHFVFNCFVKPVLIYEILIVSFDFIEVIL